MTLYTGFPAQNKQQRPPPLFCILCNACLLFRHELQLSDAVCLAYWPRAAGCPSFCLTHLHLRLRNLPSESNRSGHSSGRLLSVVKCFLRALGTSWYHDISSSHYNPPDLLQIACILMFAITAGVHKSLDVLQSWADPGSSAHNRVCYELLYRHDKCRK